MGLTCPNFNEWLYYFNLEVANLTQFQYSILSLIGAILLSVGVAVYSIWLKEVETRTLMTIALCVKGIGSFFNVALTLKWYESLGLSPYTFLFMTSSTLLPLTMGLFIIPPFVLIAKITPSHVEATVFSFSASVINGCMYVLARMMGVLINSLIFNITSDNLDDLYKLYIWEVCGAIVCLCYIPLIPTWEEVGIVQKHLAKLNLDAKTPLTVRRQGSIEPF